MKRKNPREIKVLAEDLSLSATGIAVRHFPAFSSEGASLHTHDIVEMVYVAGGEGTHIVGEREYPLAAGMLGIIHYDQAHAYLTRGSTLELYNIYFDMRRHPLPDMGADLNRVLGRILPLHPELVHERNRVIHLTFAEPENIEPIIRRMAEESGGNKPGRETAIKLNFRLFLLECARLAIKQSELAEDGPASGLMERVRFFLEENFRSDIPLQKISEVAGLNPNYLCRVFKKHTGLTLVEYLNQRRIEAAMIALSSSDDKILALSIDCGFRDLAHFNRTFRKTCGMAPGEYRRQVRARRG